MLPDETRKHLALSQFFNGGRFSATWLLSSLVRDWRLHSPSPGADGTTALLKRWFLSVVHHLLVTSQSRNKDENRGFVSDLSSVLPQHCSHVPCWWATRPFCLVAFQQEVHGRNAKLDDQRRGKIKGRTSSRASLWCQRQRKILAVSSIRVSNSKKTSFQMHFPNRLRAAGYHGGMSDQTPPRYRKSAWAALRKHPKIDLLHLWILKLNHLRRSVKTQNQLTH